MVTGIAGLCRGAWKTDNRSLFGQSHFNTRLAAFQDVGRNSVQSMALTGAIGGDAL